MVRHYDLIFLPLFVGTFVLNGDAQVTKTDRVEFPPGGLLRLDNSVGELTVQGWDRTEVEITTIKTRAVYGSQEQESASHNLDRIRTTTERRGDEIVVRTEFPRYSVFPPPVPFRGAAVFDLEYYIMVPRNARLVINHDAGEVHINDVAGDIQARVFKGEITLRLAADDQSVIDAKSDLGGVFSDFAGQERRRLWPFGHRFALKASSPAHQVHLRVGFGDIAILKMRKPPYALPSSSPQ